MVFTHSFLNKGTIGTDIIRLYEIFVTQTKFLNKLHNLLVVLSCPDMESRIINILKDKNDTAEVIGLKGSVIIKAIRIYQDYLTEICDILPPDDPLV